MPGRCSVLGRRRYPSASRFGGRSLLCCTVHIPRWVVSRLLFLRCCRFEKVTMVLHLSPMCAFISQIPLSRPPLLMRISTTCQRSLIYASQDIKSPPSSFPQVTPRPPLLPSSHAAFSASLVTLLAGFSVPLVASQVRSDINFETHYLILLYTTLFGVVHSGLASVRPYLTQFLGERIYRVLFALTSLPSAAYVITYFIAHRYDGIQLWQLQGVAHMHDFVMIITTVSFLFLYPATFNLLEVAAIQKPTFRIYETGVMRITRHPQLFGQILWCISHTVWMGNSFALTASLGLIAHHLFGAWNGDRRLRDRYGEEWLRFAQRTSIVPFVAIWKQQQQLRISEFLKPAYVGVLLTIWGLHAAHPAVLRIVGGLHLWHVYFDLVQCKTKVKYMGGNAVQLEISQDMWSDEKKRFCCRNCLRLSETCAYDQRCCRDARQYTYTDMWNIEALQHGLSRPSLALTGLDSDA